MAQKYDRAREIRESRHKELEGLIAEVKAGVEKYATFGAEKCTFGEGSLWSDTVDDLEKALDGMRRYLLRKLTDALGSDAKVAEADLFEGKLDVWKDQWKELRIDRLARRAGMIHELVLQARKVLPKIEDARREHHAREHAKFEAELAARRAAFADRVEREQPRKFTEWELRKVVRKAAGYDAAAYRMDRVIKRAEDLKLITELEAILAREKFHEPIWDTTH